MMSFGMIKGDSVGEGQPQGGPGGEQRLMR
jgi:hypothetical protein